MKAIKTVVIAMMLTVAILVVMASLPVLILFFSTAFAICTVYFFVTVLTYEDEEENKGS